jgi:hypothetical protein
MVPSIGIISFCLDKKILVSRPWRLIILSKNGLFEIVKCSGGSFKEALALRINTKVKKRMKIIDFAYFIDNQ